MNFTKLAVAKWEVCEVGGGGVLSEVGFCEVGSLRSGKKFRSGRKFRSGGTPSHTVTVTVIFCALESLFWCVNDA